MRDWSTLLRWFDVGTRLVCGDAHFPPTTNVGPTYLCYLCSHPKHKIWRPLILFTNSKHIPSGGGGTLIFHTYVGPDHFWGYFFWCFVMTPKDIHKIFIPQKIFIFLKTLKGIEPTYEWKYYSTPSPSTLSSPIETGAGGVQTQITEKTLIRVFFGGFLQLYFYGSKGSNIYRGCNFFFFFLGGGGGGVANPYFYRNLYNVWFFFFFLGGGGVGTT